MTGKGWLPISAVWALLASAGPGHAVTTTMPLRDNVGIGEVSGGERANAHWAADVGNDEFRRALHRSLDATGLLERARGEGRYSLSASLESISLPQADFTASARVRYTLVDKSCGERVYEEVVSSEYTMVMWDSFMRANVNRKVTEGAARANIGILTEKLLQMSLFQEEVSLSR